MKMIVVATDNLEKKRQIRKYLDNVPQLSSQNTATYLIVPMIH